MEKVFLNIIYIMTVILAPREDSGSGRAPMCLPWTRGCLTTGSNLEHHFTRIQREMRCDDFIFPLNISAGIDHSVCPSVTA